MNGLLVLDKPQGMTSHDVVQRVRRLLRIRRVGHAGTLDPLATGILLVAVGEATRLVEFLMEGVKSYAAILKLGEITDTQDGEGRILETRPWNHVSEEAVREACRDLTGCIRQTPPMYSALKREGVPLYRLARQGQEVDRESREISIFSLKITEVDLPFISLEIDCSKGTYIRTLCHDLGQKVGSGAHMTALRRTRSGAFREGQSITLEQLAAAAEQGCVPLIPLSEILAQHSSLVLDDASAARLRNGIPPALCGVSGHVPEEGSLVNLLHGGNLVAVARFEPHRQNEKRGDFVLMRVFHPA